LLLLLLKADVIWSQSEWNRIYYGVYHMINYNHYPSKIELSENSIPNLNMQLSSICDSSGSLLYYKPSSFQFSHSWGIDPKAKFMQFDEIRNAEHKALKGSDGGLIRQMEKVLDKAPYESDFSWNALSSSVFFPNPRNAKQFYVVSINGISVSRGYQLSNRAQYPIPPYEGVLWAGIIDSAMSEEVVSVQPNTILGQGFGEFAVVRSPDRCKFWILAASWAKDSLFVFKCDSAGIALNSIVPYLTYGDSKEKLRHGYIYDEMKVSPDGAWILFKVFEIDNYMGVSKWNQLFRFDPQLGKVLAKHLIVKAENGGGYSAEFSPNSKSLFIERFKKLPVNLNRDSYNLIRLNLDSVSTNQEVINLDSILYKSELNINFDWKYRNINLGQDACLYFHDVYNQTVLSSLLVIRNPNDDEKDWIRDTIFPPMPYVGFDTTFNSGFNGYGLLPHIPSTGNIRRLVWSKPLKTPCLGEAITFSFQNGYLADSVRWSFGDGKEAVGKGNTILHRFTDTGLLQVRAIFYRHAMRDTLFRPIRVNYIKQPYLGTDTLLCSGARMSLDASDASIQHYRWSHGPQTAAISIDTAGTYVLEVENEHCLARDTIQVTLLSCDIQIGGNCAGDSTRLTIDGIQPDSMSLWVNGLAFGVINNAATMRLDTGLHTLVIEQHRGGKSRRFNMQHTIRPLPVFSLGNDTLLCAGNRLLLQPPAHLGNYRWSTGATSNTLDVSAAGSYHLKANDGWCDGSDTISIASINCQPIISGFCLGDSTSIMLSGDAESAGLDWGDGANISVAIPSVARHQYRKEGAYTLQINWQQQNLQTSSRHRIAITELPEPFLSDSQTVCKNGSFEPEQISGGARYRWSTGSSSRNIRITESGIYALQVSKGACIVHDTVKLSIKDCGCRVYVPNAFTPDMNGVNERFEPIFDCVPTQYTWHIYNRWGHQIYAESGATPGWNGRYRGQTVPTGVYVWQLHFTDPLSGLYRSEKGTVLLLR